MDKSNKELNRKLMRANIKIKTLKMKIDETQKLKEIIRKAKLALKFEHLELEHQLSEYTSKDNGDNIKTESPEDGTNFNEELITDPNPSKNLNEIYMRGYLNSKDEEDDPE